MDSIAISHNSVIEVTSAVRRRCPMPVIGLFSPSPALISVPWPVNHRKIASFTNAGLYPSSLWPSNGVWLATRFVAVKSWERCGGDDEEGNRRNEEENGVGEMAENSIEPQTRNIALKVFDRRSRCESLNTLPVGSVEPLTVPGIGYQNLRKLVDKGFEDVARLKQLYRDKLYAYSSSISQDRNGIKFQQFLGKSTEKMVEYLKSSVGIVHKNHAESITSFIKDIVDEELKDDAMGNEKHAQKSRIAFCVEGNISVGKTTFLQRIDNETIELQDLVEIVPEPIGKWQNVGPDHFNILDAFYASPQRYAYTFQNYVFVTRLMQKRESSEGIKPLRLMERSIFSDRMVFVCAVHEANWMNDMEISIYDSWFDPVISSLPGLVPDGFIYLRASPDTCYKRMMVRNRAEEGGVSLDYLRGLHEKHENWLFPSQPGCHSTLLVSQIPMHMGNSVHPDIRGHVFYLEDDHMHPSIQKVPALVLDCEPNIDFSKDIEAKKQYAHQVAEFFAFVKEQKEILPAAFGTGDQNKSEVMRVPCKGGLWMPAGVHFPESVLKSLGIKGSMSFL